MSATIDLRDLRHKPFDLLVELERRSRSAAVGQNVVGSSANEWVGVGIRIGTLSFVVPRSEVREVLEYPAITPVPRAKSWVLGLANVRGQLLPVFDMSGFAAETNIRPDRRARVISVSHPEVSAGFAVNEVFGFRRFSETNFRDTSILASQSGLNDYNQYLAGSFARGSDSWPILSLRQVVESVDFAQAAE
ncbi:MAG: chemotaxis protein CheW [Pseudomonadota bacterium]